MATDWPNGVARVVVFKAYLTSDHVSVATGKTIAITISKNGATSFSNPNAGATNATEMASGFYKFTLDTTDTGTNGPLAWRGAVATVDDVGDVFDVVNATNGKMTGVPAAVAGASSGLHINGSNSGTTTLAALTVTGATTMTGGLVGNITGNLSGTVGSVTAAVNVGQLAGQTVTAAAGVTFPTSVASPTNITAGTITTATNLTNAPTNGDLTATMKTSVKTQVTDGLAVDTYAEPGQGNPAATTTLALKLAWLYKAWRNQSTQSSSQYSLYNDAANVVDQKAPVSDDGSTLTRGEVATGP
jgi:hypothetical protein